MRENGRSVRVKCVATTLDALEGTYAKHFPADVPTVLEASTNSFHIAKRLAAIGRKAVVLASDVFSGVARKDRINDRIDAGNPARAGRVGQEAVKAAGYGKKAEYVAAVAAKLYGHLPEATGTDSPEKSLKKKRKTPKARLGA